jgi:uncharacterized protein (DUF2062 family)
VFRRRNPIPLLQRLSGWLWPHIGWRRHGLYVLKRLTRMPGTPHSIAAGFACGAAISFTPFWGLHIALSILLAIMVRGNYIAAAIGTLIGNPWTFPLICVSTYELGQYLLGGTPAVGQHLDPLTLGALLENIHALLWPMTVGSIPMAIAAWIGSYFTLVRVVGTFQEARRHRRDRRLAGRRFVARAPKASPDTGIS